MLHFLHLAADPFMFGVLVGFALAMLVSIGFAVRKALKKGFRSAL